MISMKTPMILAVSGAFALSACTNPSTLGGSPDDPNRNAKQGAAIGAGLGAVFGSLVAGHGNKTEAVIAGALVGGAVGGFAGNNLDRQEADLRAQLDNQDVIITNTGDRLIVTLPQDILFATDSYSVRPDLQRDLNTVAGNLQAYPNSTIQIIGHTDNTGDAAYNQQLSQRRANAVANVLLNAGIPSARVQAFGRGEEQPVSSNLSPEGRALNRRVEIVILPNA
jgi:outer membrane protein OmpA-like peptidoglycan-associated protein